MLGPGVLRLRRHRPSLCCRCSTAARISSVFHAVQSLLGGNPGTPVLRPAATMLTGAARSRPADTGPETSSSVRPAAARWRPQAAAPAPRARPHASRHAVLFGCRHPRSRNPRPVRSDTTSSAADRTPGRRASRTPASSAPWPAATRARQPVAGRGEPAVSGGSSAGRTDASSGSAKRVPRGRAASVALASPVFRHALSGFHSSRRPESNQPGRRARGSRCRPRPPSRSRAAARPRPARSPD